MNCQSHQPNDLPQAPLNPVSTDSNLSEVWFNRARASLRQLLTWHVHHHAHLQVELQDELDVLNALRDKLEQAVVRIAVFGLVSRGKSAVLNALLGQRVFQTGPLNGVTQWPRSVRWSPGSTAANPDGFQLQGPKVQVELIDTPGLDEINGQVRAQMAKDVTQQADLILFVIAGDLTRTEYQALCELREAQKPLLLVFNKMDLYPHRDRESIYQHLQNQRLRELITVQEVVLTAADPAPLQVRVEWPDGRISYEWESLPPQVDQLKQQLLHTLNQEGQVLLALNALLQASAAEKVIAEKVAYQQKSQAEALIWRFMQVKALAIALSPVAVVDLLGGILADLLLVRGLARLYGFPITQHESAKLWRAILLSSGSLLISQLGSSLLLGLGHPGAAFAEAAGGISSFLGVAAAQAGIAGYGLYLVAQAGQSYLTQGSTWGPLGPNTIIQEMLDHLAPNTILYRLKHELKNKFKKL
ncbi:MAG TPA: GTP-binding protein [Candidatus Caenarcaniphilales bacterium]